MSHSVQQKIPGGLMARTFLGPLLNKAPVPYTVNRAVKGSIGYGTTTPTGGMVAQMRAQSTSGTLFAICDRIITAYSQVEWCLFYKNTDNRRVYHNGQDDRRRVVRHAALDLWNQPNPFFTGIQFRESAQQHEELVGEQYWLIVKNRFGLPQELWFVRPDRMRPVPDVENYLAGYVYTSPGGEQVPLAREDVIFLRRPNPLDPYRGLGAVQAIMSELEGNRLSSEYLRNFFANSARPGGVIEADQNISDDDFNQFQARWAETHRGVANASRVAILEAGMTWKDTRYTFDEMRLVELKDTTRETIREAFGFPKAMLGATDDVNKANAYAGEVMFARWMTEPRLKRAREMLNRYILPLYGSSAANLEFDYVNPIPEDIELAATTLLARSAAAKNLVDSNLWEGADILRTVGLPEMAELSEPRALPAATAPPLAPSGPGVTPDTGPSE